MEYIEIKIKKIVQETEAENCYRLVFEDTEKTFRMPVVIGADEARPLIALLDCTEKRRPRTHSLFYDFVRAAGYEIRCMHITGFEQGIFTALLTFEGGEERLRLDCRPSDAVILLLLSKGKMYVSREVAERVGRLLHARPSSASLTHRLRVLEDRLKRLVAEERYEEAAVLRDEINPAKAQS